MTDEIEASLAIDELALWVEALASDAENLGEIANLGRVLSDEIDRFLEPVPDKPVPVSARQAIAALEERAARAMRIQSKGLRVRS